MLQAIEAIGSAATAVGVFFAVYQLVQSHRQAVTAFEDSLAKEYREIAAKLPTKALLGEQLSEGEYSEHFDELYHYLDLCNEQVFLSQVGRVSEKTWTFWRDGIASNLKRPAFERAWSEVAARSGSDFSELRSVFPPKPLQVAAAVPNKTMQPTR